jgi:hypothetical protein
MKNCGMKERHSPVHLPKNSQSIINHVDALILAPMRTMNLCQNPKIHSTEYRPVYDLFIYHSLTGSSDNRRVV